jgi:hypothetical protein
MFPKWIPLPSKVQYDFGEADGSSYTASWKIPATIDDLNTAKALASKVERYRTESYPHKTKIEHAYYPDLTIQRSTVRGDDAYQNNTGDPFTDSTSGSNVLQNVGFYVATFEWRQKPWNIHKLKHARVRPSMEGSFEELPGSTLEAYPKNGDPKTGLTTGIQRVARQREFQVLYDFVPFEDYDAEHLEDLQGKVNLDDRLFGRRKGQVLYVNSETEDVIDSLGARGFAVKHNFVLKPRDWNIVDVTPPPGSTSRETSEAYAVIKGLPNTDDNRAYEYALMRPDNRLFYYGWEA